MKRRHFASVLALLLCVMLVVSAVPTAAGQDGIEKTGVTEARTVVRTEADSDSEKDGQKAGTSEGNTTDSASEEIREGDTAKAEAETATEGGAGAPENPAGDIAEKEEKTKGDTTAEADTEDLSDGAAETEKEAAGEISGEASEENLAEETPGDAASEEPAEDNSEEAAAEDTEEVQTVPAGTGEGTYLAFCSDLHGLSDVLENAMKGFPQNMSYVSLVGDMVGERGGDAPEYNSSEVYNRIKAIFPNISESKASIIWADHDKGVVDDSGIVKWPDGYTSGEVCSIEDNSGKTVAYIYAIGFYHMTTGGETSRAAAAAFKSWVDGKEESIPVIVLCHVPLAAQRGDNYGATYWNEALNYAATSVENITTTEETAIIRRNVVYLYGHNHTTDKTEYLYQAGTSMSVQVDKVSSLNSSSASLLTGNSLMTVTETYDTELGAMAKAEGVTSNIYYTAMIPGYLKTSGNATLMKITDSAITMTKHNGGEEVSIGTDGATGEEVGTSATIPRVNWSEPTYTWSDDLSEVTASHTENAYGSVETETVSTAKTVTKEATCEEEGEETYTAVFENEAFETQTKTVVTEPLGHEAGSAVREKEVAATCEKDGSYESVVYCTRCGEELSRETGTIPKLGHAWGSWTITKAATSTTKGIKTRVCAHDSSHKETMEYTITSSSSSTVPKTGDENKPLPLVCALLGAAAVMLALYFGKRAGKHRSAF